MAVRGMEEAIVCVDALSFMNMDSKQKTLNTCFLPIVSTLKSNFCQNSGLLNESYSYSQWRQNQDGKNSLMRNSSLVA